MATKATFHERFWERGVRDDATKGTGTPCKSTEGIVKTWGMYQQIWRAFGKKATHAAYDWTVKADADAVLSLGKHVEPAHLLPVPATGAFLINCEV